MSFDLYFYKKKGSSLEEPDVANYLNNNLTYNISDSARQWDYENPATGVYFLIDWNKPNSDDDLNEGIDGFIDLNFSFNLNFFRPDFFGKESFPIIEKLVHDLGVMVYNPQVEGDINITGITSPGAFYANWYALNRKFSKEMFEEYKLRYLPAEQSDYVWKYQINRTTIETEIVEDIFVPTIMVVESNADSQLYTMCVWPEHIPILLPKVDFVIIKKVYKSFFKTVTESGMVPYQSIIQDCGDAFTLFNNEVPDLLLLRQDAADSITKKFNKLKIISAIADFGGKVNFDSFVNTY